MLQFRHMERIWYIRLEKEVEGPYSVEELKLDKRVTMRTLAWKKGMPLWLPIAAIPELAKALFEEGSKEVQPGPEGVISLDQDLLPLPFLWLLLALLLVVFLYYFI